MAIPASVTLYVRWTNGQPLSGGVYTAVAPDVPVGHTWTFALGATLGVDNDSPWNGQYLADLSAGWDDQVTTTVSSSTMQASLGRLLIEFEGSATVAPLVTFSPTSAANGRIRIRPNSGNVMVEVRTPSTWGEVYLGTWPTNASCVEVIYDLNNATAAERVKARIFEVGAAAGSFTSATVNPTQLAGDQYTSIIVNDQDTNTYKVNRIIVSDDITEDLSAVTEGGGAAELMPQACL